MVEVLTISGELAASDDVGTCKQGITKKVVSDLRDTVHFPRTLPSGPDEGLWWNRNSFECILIIVDG
jgi:hypothetical protein